MAKQWLRGLWYASTQVPVHKQCRGKGDDVDELDRHRNLSWNRVAFPWGQAGGSKVTVRRLVERAGSFNFDLRGPDRTVDDPCSPSTLWFTQRGWDSTVKLDLSPGLLSPTPWFMALFYLLLVLPPEANNALLQNLRVLICKMWCARHCLKGWKYSGWGWCWVARMSLLSRGSYSGGRRKIKHGWTNTDYNDVECYKEKWGHGRGRKSDRRRVWAI